MNKSALSQLILETLSQITPPSVEHENLARFRQAQLTKPPGSLGELESLSIKLSGIYRSESPTPDTMAIVLAAGSHGVSAEGVSAFPSSVTAEMLNNFSAGGAAINVISNVTGAKIFLVDTGVINASESLTNIISHRYIEGTENFSLKPALTADLVIRYIDAGISLSNKLALEAYSTIALGDMGIGNTTTAAAHTASRCGLPAEDVTGSGTMISDNKRALKVAIIDQAISVHDPDANDAISLLASFGGTETAFHVGVCLGAARNNIPIVLDGFPTTAAALIADCFTPNLRHYFIASHQSEEPGHLHALNFLKLTPLLKLSMRLGEGTGAALCFPIIRSAAACLNEMATFNDAKVSEASG